MTLGRKQLLTLLAVVGIIASGAGVVSAAVPTVDTVDAYSDPAGTSENANHFYDITYADSGTVKEIELRYPDGFDIQSVGDITVMYGGESQGVSSVSGSGTTNLTITLQQGISVSGGETVSIESAGEEFINPDTAGDYSVDVVTGDGTSTQTTTTTMSITSSSTTEGTTLQDTTVSVTNDTSEVYLEVTNTSGDYLHYQVFGIDSDGVSTQVDSGSIEATSNDTTRMTWTPDTSSYEEYRVVVSEDASDSDSESAESIDIGATVDQVSGSGGGIFGGSGGGLFTMTNILIALAIGGVAYYAGLLDPIANRLN